ncbi:MAG: thermonuclease family protein [Methylovirgula sp.]
MPISLAATIDASASLCCLALALALSSPMAYAVAKYAEPLGACPSAGTQSAKVAKIDEGLDITLQDGRSLHLAGLDPPLPTHDHPDLALKAQNALAGHVGAGITFVPLSYAPDRWGRLPAFVFVQDKPGEVPQSLAQALLAQGLARFMPALEARPCRADFLAAEETARDAHLGLWRDPFYAVLDATDRAAFDDKGATNVIVEGRLLSVTSNPFRTTLAFSPRPERGFAVTLQQRNLAIFERSGLSFRALIGQRLRIHGLLDLRFGPQIEISSPDELELISDGQSQDGSPVQNLNAARGASQVP